MTTFKEHRSVIGSHILRQTPVKRVHFKLPSNLKGTLLNFTRGLDHRPYQDLVCILRDSEIKDEDLCLLLRDAQDCISLLDQNLRLFVQVVLVVKWAHRGPEAVKAFQGFLLDLCSAHSYHTKAVLDHLVNCFKPIEGSEWLDSVPPPEEEALFQNVHHVLRKLLKVIPMAGDLLLQSIISIYPYIKQSSHAHLRYVHNILAILRYQPHFRKDFLHLIVNKLVQLDVCAPRAEIEAAEDDENDMDMEDEGMFDMDEDSRSPASQGMKHLIGNTLDVLMLRLFTFIKDECENPESHELDLEKTLILYRELIQVFEKIILLTHNTHHVQFLLWYVCSLRPKLAELFLNFLWGQVSSVNVAPVIRQTAAAYIASFLARANFIRLEFLKSILHDMSKWIHSYIGNQDGQEFVVSDYRVHTVFYSVCQALFYVVTFRHKDLFNTRKNMVFLRGLNMSKMVTCSLNPLRVCLPDVAKKFASVTRAYQLVYCNTVIERNARNTVPVVHNGDSSIRGEQPSSLLETFFPFDPYKLLRSAALISPHYCTYQPVNTTDENEQGNHKADNDEDDFLQEPMVISSSVTDRLFSYCSSPGFRQDNLSMESPRLRQHI